VELGPRQWTRFSWPMGGWVAAQPALSARSGLNCHRSTGDRRPQSRSLDRTRLASAGKRRRRFRRYDRTLDPAAGSAHYAGQRYGVAQSGVAGYRQSQLPGAAFVAKGHATGQNGTAGDRGIREAWCWTRRASWIERSSAVSKRS
jgi:hypothetical protein